MCSQVIKEKGLVCVGHFLFSCSFSLINFQHDFRLPGLVREFAFQGLSLGWMEYLTQNSQEVRRQRSHSSCVLRVVSFATKKSNVDKEGSRNILYDSVYCIGGPSFQHGGRLVHQNGCSLLLEHTRISSFPCS